MLINFVIDKPENKTILLGNEIFVQLDTKEKQLWYTDKPENKTILLENEIFVQLYTEEKQLWYADNQGEDWLVLGLVIKNRMEKE